MGSSCYCRGNSRNAEILQEELKNQNLDESVELVGTLCEGHCKDGPILSLDGKEYQKVQAGTVLELVRGLKESLDDLPSEASK